MNASNNFRYLGVSRWLRIRAAERPDAVALIVARTAEPPTVLSYRALEDSIHQAAVGLKARGVKKGDRVILMVEPGEAFFSLAFALFRIGAVMVGVDPGMGIRRVRTALEQINSNVFIGNTKAQLARVLFRWGGPSLNLSITVGSTVEHTFLHALTRARGIQIKALTYDKLMNVGKQVSPQIHPEDTQRITRDEEPAAILFTSGSTGSPKGVLYTHGLFEAQLKALARAYSIKPGERELATFPLFALFAPALGMTAIVPRIDFTRPGTADPDHLAELIQTHSVTSMFGSPALLSHLSEAVSAHDPRLVTLARVVSAGAPVPSELLERIRQALSPEASIHTPYGATEAMPITTITAKEILAEATAATRPGVGVCVGFPCKGMDVRIVPIVDGPVPVSSLDSPVSLGSVGEIAVRGPVVTSLYVGEENATQLAKLEHPTGMFHRMGDLGYFDADGRLWFSGRKSERVRLRDGELYTAPVEAIFNKHPAVARSALVGIMQDGQTIPVIAVELKLRAWWDCPHDRVRITKELRALSLQCHDTTKIRHFLFHPRFPVDPRHNAKIGRPELARWAVRQLG